MKIDRIEMNNWQYHHHLALDLKPLTLICGPNESGKSSIADAIAFAVGAELRRVDAKSDRPLLITDGAKAGNVRLTCEGATIGRDVASGKLTDARALPVGKDSVTEAVPYLLDPPKFARVSADERRALLLAVMRVALTPDAIREELINRGHPAALLGELHDREALPMWLTRTERLATEARGAWRAVTGEVYGAKKAEDWRIEPPAAAPTPNELAEAASAVLERSQAVDIMNRQIGAAEARTKQRAAQRAKVDALQQQAKDASRLTDLLLAAETELSRCAKAEADALAHYETTKARASQDYDCCPHCGGAVIRDHLTGRLAEYHPQRDAPTATQVETAQHAHLTAQFAKTAAEKHVVATRAAHAAAVAAADAIAEMNRGPSAPDDATAAGDLAANLKAAQAALAAAREHDATLRAAEAQAYKAETETAEAARWHKTAQQWVAIAAALAPDGIAGERLAAALGAFNATLAEAAVQLGFKPAAIDADMIVTMGGRRYRMMSESMQWRADMMIAVALAHHSGLRFAVLDRLDVLDAASRTPALRWLYWLTTAGRMDTILVLGTTREPPKLPPAVAVHWLGAPASLAA